MWRICKHYGNYLKKEKLIKTLDKKCEHRGVTYKSIDDFFTPELEKEAYKNWQNMLGNLTPGLPECAHLLSETKLLVIKAIFDSL